ncbi:tyrosine-type recombinase/integrase [Clostridium sp. WILCCON 0269]|uniref:Tyrosine-type recombinase/integrase n=1 Tax=Candidatus Clostridium eludens TaxID=3381663 RepID=A0ABW8SHD3_9CLOT
MLLADLLREYMYECEIKKYSIRTIKEYRNNIRAFFNYLDKEYDIKSLEQISHVQIKHYFKYLTNQGRKETYINGILKNLRSFYKFCEKEEYTCNNPCKKVDWQKEPKVIINSFSDKEAIKMLDVYNYSNYYNARNKCIIATLIDTGIRNLELCSLGMLDVRETVVLVHGKGNKERYVPISPMLKKIMIKYERIRNSYMINKFVKCDNYFLSYRGNPLTVEAVERVIKGAGKKAKVRENIRCSPHTFRHYFAQTQLKNGLDVYSLSRLLGHENISITRRYLQSIKDEEIMDLALKTSPLMNIKGGGR